MAKKPIIDRINAAREQLGQGKAVAGLEQLLVDVSMHLMSKDDVAEERRMETAKDYWRLYSQYTSRLSELGYQVVKASEPRAERVNLTKWYVLGGGRSEQEERLSLDFEYRVYEEDWRDDEQFVNVEEGRDGRYAVKRHSMYVDVAWLLLSDQEVAKRVKLETLKQELWYKEHHREDRPRRIKEAEDRLADLHRIYKDEDEKIAKLQAQIAEQEQG